METKLTVSLGASHLVNHGAYIVTDLVWFSVCVTYSTFFVSVVCWITSELQALFSKFIILLVFATDIMRTLVG